MDAELKKALDLRLARGEITEAEYDRLLEKLDGLLDSNAKPGTSEHGPLLHQLDNELLIFSDRIEVAGRTKRFSDVISISGGGTALRINLLPSYKNSWIEIRFEGGSSYSQDEDRSFLGNRRHEAIQKALQLIRQATIGHRLARATAQLNKVGQLQVGFELKGLTSADANPVYLDANGIVTNGRLSLDLRRCGKEGVLELGTTRYNKVDPTEVYASYTKTFYERGSKHALKFTAGGAMDTDVALAMLDRLSRSRS